MDIEKRLYHVTFQAFRREGAVIEERYYELPAPFFPEDAKIAYMREYPDSIQRRELVIIVQFSDQEANREKVEWWKKKDAQLEKKRQAIQDKAAKGGYGSGDDAQKKVQVALKEVRNDEISE